MKKLKLLLFVLCSYTCFACLNEKHVNKSGKVSIDAFSLGETRYLKSHNKDELELYLKNLQQEKNKTSDDIFSNQNNIAVALIKLGRLDEAEKILLKLKKEAPDDYYVTINLGTIYELQGKNEQALQFIKKGLLIEPDSHNGTEWFHVKVLEFKLKNIPEADIPNQNILNLTQPGVAGRDLAYDVSYQLHERIPFTPAPNLMMAKILQEFADYLADSISIKAAYLFYEMGMDYDRQNVLKLVDKRDALIPYFKKYNEAVPLTNNYYLDRIMQTIDEDKVSLTTSLLEKGLNYLKEQEETKKRRQNRLFTVGGIFVLLAGIGFFIFRKKIKK